MPRRAKEGDTYQQYMGTVKLTKQLLGTKTSNLVPQAVSFYGAASLCDGSSQFLSSRSRLKHDSSSRKHVFLFCGIAIYSDKPHRRMVCQYLADTLGRLARVLLFAHCKTYEASLAVFLRCVFIPLDYSSSHHALCSTNLLFNRFAKSVQK
jgi:hypothetical protein